MMRARKSLRPGRSLHGAVTAGLRAESARKEGYDEGNMAVEGRHDWKQSQIIAKLTSTILNWEC